MIIPDVNVLIYAVREDAERHAQYREWLETALAGQEPVGLSELVLSGVIRALTHPRVFDPPTSLTDAVRYVTALRAQPRAVALRPGPRHWSLFAQLCTDANARGNLVPDAYHAALALESGAEWITTDLDFARFTGLRWRHPLR